MSNERAVVSNLDVANVTWARTYIRAAKANGITVTGDHTLPVDRIFIGDKIFTPSITDQSRHLYFLGASSIPPSDSESQDEVNREFSNMDWATLVLLVSKAEKWKVLSKRSDLTDKLLVNGFPLNIKELIKLRKTRKYPKSLVFLGQTREIKNTDFEIELCNNLKRLGFNLYHLSSGEIYQNRDLERAGCVVIENVEFKRYWELLSRFQFFASTSYYESLCVSGIEASALGCTPVVPNHSGFIDWCPDELRYDPFDINHALDIIHRKAKSTSFSADLNWYDSKNYFSRINFLQNE